MLGTTTTADLLDSTSMIIGIFGTGRNGSSLITRLLDGLGNTYVHPVEEYFATTFNEMAGHREVGRFVMQNCTTKPLKQIQGSVDSERLRSFSMRNIDALVRDYIGRCKQLPTAPQLNVATILPKHSYRLPDYMDDYLGGIAKALRPDLVPSNFAFKTIETPYIADYSHSIPNMRFIHIIRDPIAVCSSQKRSLLENKRLPASYLGYDWLACMMVKRWIPHAKYISAHSSDPAHLTVRYEDLVAAPHQEIKRIAGWLGLTLPPRPDRQTIFCNLDMDSWGFNPSKKGVETPTNVVPNLQTINQYEEILTKREIDLINAWAAPYLNSLGYTVKPMLTRSELFIQHIIPDKWETMHCRGLRSWLRAIIGMFYRRLQIVVS